MTRENESEKNKPTVGTILGEQKKQLEENVRLLEGFAGSLERSRPQPGIPDEFGATLGRAVIRLTEPESSGQEFLYKVGKDIIGELVLEGDALLLAEACFEMQFPIRFSNRMEGLVNE